VAHRLVQFLNIYNLQDGVATRFGCDEFFNDSFFRKLFVKCGGERILKINHI